MEMTRLGRTDLVVSRVCFGTWQFGGDWGEVDRGEALAAIRSARRAGINFFDTAQGYGFGVSEQILGEGLGDELKKHRDDVVIATKGGLRRDGDDLLRDSSPGWLRQGVEESLGHLGVDHIDIYQVHWPDSDTPFEETAGILSELVREGKIRHVGVSNFSTEQMAALDRSITVETTQPPFHLFRQDFERDELPWCREHDVGVLVYGPLAHGLLSGRFSPGDTLPDDDWRSDTDLFSETPSSATSGWWPSSSRSPRHTATPWPSWPWPGPWPGPECTAPSPARAGPSTSRAPPPRPMCS